eukprot:46322-Prymnesium_polylepis.1
MHGTALGSDPQAARAMLEQLQRDRPPPMALSAFLSDRPPHLNPRGSSTNAIWAATTNAFDKPRGGPSWRRSHVERRFHAELVGLVESARAYAGWEADASQTQVIPEEAQLFASWHQLVISFGELSVSEGEAVIKPLPAFSANPAFGGWKDETEIRRPLSE